MYGIADQLMCYAAQQANWSLYKQALTGDDDTDSQSQQSILPQQKITEC